MSLTTTITKTELDPATQKQYDELIKLRPRLETVLLKEKEKIPFYHALLFPEKQEEEEEIIVVDDEEEEKEDDIETLEDKIDEFLKDYDFLLTENEQNQISDLLGLARVEEAYVLIFNEKDGLFKKIQEEEEISLAPEDQKWFESMLPRWNLLKKQFPKEKFANSTEPVKKMIYQLFLLIEDQQESDSESEEEEEEEKEPLVPEKLSRKDFTAKLNRELQKFEELNKQPLENLEKLQQISEWLEVNDQNITPLSKDYRNQVDTIIDQMDKWEEVSDIETYEGLLVILLSKLDEISEEIQDNPKYKQLNDMIKKWNNNTNDTELLDEIADKIYATWRIQPRDSAIDLDVVPIARVEKESELPGPTKFIMFELDLLNDAIKEDDEEAKDAIGKRWAKGGKNFDVSNSAHLNNAAKKLESLAKEEKLTSDEKKKFAKILQLLEKTSGGKKTTLSTPPPVSSKPKPKRIVPEQVRKEEEMSLKSIIKQREQFKIPANVFKQLDDKPTPFEAPFELLKQEAPFELMKPKTTTPSFAPTYTPSTSSIWSSSAGPKPISPLSLSSPKPISSFSIPTSLSSSFSIPSFPTSLSSPKPPISSLSPIITTTTTTTTSSPSSSSSSSSSLFSSSSSLSTKSSDDAGVFSNISEIGDLKDLYDSLTIFAERPDEREKLDRDYALQLSKLGKEEPRHFFKRQKTETLTTPSQHQSLSKYEIRRKILTIVAKIFGTLARNTLSDHDSVNIPRQMSEKEWANASVEDREFLISYGQTVIHSDDGSLTIRVPVMGEKK